LSLKVYSEIQVLKPHPRGSVWSPTALSRDRLSENGILLLVITNTNKKGVKGTLRLICKGRVAFVFGYSPFLFLPARILLECRTFLEFGISNGKQIMLGFIKCTASLKKRWPPIFFAATSCFS